MTVDEILTEWQKDSVIDNTKIGSESLNIPSLHSKYLRMHAMEKVGLTKLENQFKKLYKVKRQYYSGQLDKKDLEKYGWEQFQLKILKQDMQHFIDGDDDLCELQNMISTQQEKVSTLDQIIRSINTRNFIIKNYIDWQKFENGIV